MNAWQVIDWADPATNPPVGLVVEWHRCCAGGPCVLLVGEVVADTLGRLSLRDASVAEVLHPTADLGEQRDGDTVWWRIADGWPIVVDGPR